MPASPPPKSAAPPSIGRTVSAPPPASPPPAPAAAAPSRPPPCAQTLPQQPPECARSPRAALRPQTTGAGVARPAKKGLGAKNAAPVDFAEAGRRAAAEAEQIRQLGYDHEDAEAQAAREAAALELKNKSAAATSTSAKQAASSGANAADVERLRIGEKKRGYCALPRVQPAAPKTCVVFRPRKLPRELTFLTSPG